jgi:hypothetical protein
MLGNFVKGARQAFAGTRRVWMVSPIEAEIPDGFERMLLTTRIWYDACDASAVSDSLW